MIRKLFRIVVRPLRWLKLKINGLGSSHCCYICRNRFGHFIPFRESVSPFIRMLKCVGSDVNNYLCPFCGCNDRERHLVMYFDELHLWNEIKDAKVLHFAPEKTFAVHDQAVVR